MEDYPMDMTPIDPVMVAMHRADIMRQVEQDRLAAQLRKQRAQIGSRHCSAKCST
jgi:hypothetical protein